MPPDANGRNVPIEPLERITIDAIEDSVSPVAYALLEQRQIAGAALVVVRAAGPRDDSLVPGTPEARDRDALMYCRGYGYSDIERRGVVDVHSTPFDCGSCARILAVVGALQLWQEEAIELDKDINAYLPRGLHVDSIFPAPVTLSRLLTHTSGFCDSRESGGRDGMESNGNSRPTSSSSAVHGVFEDDCELFGGPKHAQTPLTRHLKNNRQVRVSPPGTLYRDCEHNYLLVGALIEHCSGLEYQTYLSKRILGPLDMHTMGHPPPPGSEEESAGEFLKHYRPKGYTISGEEREGRKQRRPFPPHAQSVPLSPTTGLVATPVEMGRMLQTCLQFLEEGQLGGGGGMLMEQALQEMHAAHFRSQGYEVAYGFMRRQLWPRGPVLLFHSADEVPGTDCLFCLFPQYQLGVWIGCNTTPQEAPVESDERSESGDGEVEEEDAAPPRFVEELLETFVQRFFPPNGGRGATDRSPWFQSLPPLRPDPLLELFCFPCAGGSAPVMYEAWCSLLPDFIQVRAVLLPGRGTRVKEAPIGSLSTLAELVGTAMMPLLGEEPFAFFGHGFGAVLAFEVARFLQAKAGRAPLHLFVSGQGSPAYYSQRGLGSHSWADSLSTPPPSTLKLHMLTDSELAFLLSTSTRMPRHFRRNSLMLRAMMATIRADIMAEETYVYQNKPIGTSFLHGAARRKIRTQGINTHYNAGVGTGKEDPVLACPITTFVGTMDEHVNEEALGDWVILGDGYKNQQLSGDHFYLEDAKSREHVLRLIGQTLVQRLSRHGNWIVVGSGNDRTKNNRNN